MEVIERRVWIATPTDAPVVAGLLHDFNREFGEATPPVGELAERVAQLIELGRIVVLLGGDGPDGVAVLRFRDALWSWDLECYLAELYVVPHRRGRGIGRSIMEAAIHEARCRGAVTMDIGVDEPDIVARHLYESLGFSNRTGENDEAVMYVYEREL